jgi:hypothetical protein
MWQTTGGIMTTFTTEDRLNAETVLSTPKKASKKVSKKYLLRSSPSNTPYMTSTGIQIGKYYQPPKYVEEDGDMLRLQSYLIGDPAMLKRQYWIGLAGKFGILFVVFAIVLVNK